MKKIVCILSVFACNAAMGDTAVLTAQIERTKAACAGISDELSDLKKMAGINTAVTAVGTVAGGVALGTGIAKAAADKKVDELDEMIAELEAAGAIEIKTDDQLYGVLADLFEETGTEEGKEVAESLRAEREALVKKSKTLGNIRTGTMAGAAVADTVGTVIAANNRVKGDLQSQINECIVATKELSNVRMQERVNGSVDTAELNRAETIVRECGAWEYVDLSKINKRATGAAISAGTGAAMAIAGTITSVSANSNSVRNDNTESGKKKEKNLNTASNVLAGGTTAASAVAVVFNATQISAIKKAATTADKCEEALK
ncbi:MAG: hypothetical protein K2I81_01240 [Alphaproteobacteria bacterium]|nr:hypothetical protein [Alphaproteobacteria bacterium]